MRQRGLRGVIRGHKKLTTFPDPANLSPEDLVQRDFSMTSPNPVRVADFTYVPTWSGFVYVVFVIDSFARTNVGWRTSKRKSADLTLEAPEQAVWARPINARLIPHSDHGSQCLSIRYSEQLEDIEFATLEWIHRYSTKRLRGHIGDIPPAEFEAAYYTEQKTDSLRPVSHKKGSAEPGVIHPP